MYINVFPDKIFNNNPSILGIFDPGAWIDRLKIWLGLALLTAP